MSARCSTRSILFAAVLLSLCSPSFAHGMSSKDLKGQSTLVRPESAPDGDAKGRVRVETDVDDDDHQFEVSVRNVDTSLDHDVYMGDGLGSEALVFVGAMKVDGSNEMKFRVRTEKGDDLPFDAADNASLAGRAVEVRSSLGTIVAGVVPAFGSGKGGKAKLNLQAAEGSPNTSAKARLKIRSKPKNGDERFELSAKKLSFDGLSYRLFVEDAAGSENFVDAGAMVRKSSSSSARYRRRTKKGDALPLGVASVVDLGGRAIEIRDGTGTVYLEGTLPSLD
jgi:hypothetical protein